MKQQRLYKFHPTYLPGTYCQPITIKRKIGSWNSDGIIVRTRLSEKDCLRLKKEDKKSFLPLWWQRWNHLVRERRSVEDMIDSECPIVHQKTQIDTQFHKLDFYLAGLSKERKIDGLILDSDGWLSYRPDKKKKPSNVEKHPEESWIERKFVYERTREIHKKKGKACVKDLKNINIFLGVLRKNKPVDKAKRRLAWKYLDSMRWLGPGNPNPQYRDGIVFSKFYCLLCRLYFGNPQPGHNKQICVVRGFNEKRGLFEFHFQPQSFKRPGGLPRKEPFPDCLHPEFLKKNPRKLRLAKRPGLKDYLSRRLSEKERTIYRERLRKEQELFKNYLYRVVSYANDAFYSKYRTVGPKHLAIFKTLGKDTITEEDLKWEKKVKRETKGKDTDVMKQFYERCEDLEILLWECIYHGKGTNDRAFFYSLGAQIRDLMDRTTKGEKLVNIVSAPSDADALERYDPDRIRDGHFQELAKFYYDDEDETADPADRGPSQSVYVRGLIRKDLLKQNDEPDKFVGFVNDIEAFKLKVKEAHLPSGHCLFLKRKHIYISIPETYTHSYKGKGNRTGERKYRHLDPRGMPLLDRIPQDFFVDGVHRPWFYFYFDGKKYKLHGHFGYHYVVVE